MGTGSGSCRSPGQDRSWLWRRRGLPVYVLPLLNPPLITTTDSDFGGVLFTRRHSTSLVALGLNIVVGYAGLLDLGYVGFYAVGAYTVGVLGLGARHAALLLLCMPIAVVATLISGVMLGAPTLRVRGDYLAIVTLGFGEIIRLILRQLRAGSAAPRGISEIPRPPSIGPSFEIPHLDWQPGSRPVVDLDNHDHVPEVRRQRPDPLLLARTHGRSSSCWSSTRSCKDSRVGRAWEATREDEDAAELMGVPTFRFKLLAFAIGRLHRRPVRRAVRRQAGLHQPGQLHRCCCRSCSSPRSSSAAQGNRWGVIVGGDRASPTSPSGSASSSRLAGAASSASR